MQYFTTFWDLLNTHDVPNSVAILWSLIVWPLALWGYYSFPRRSAPGLLVHLKRHTFLIDGAQREGLMIDFENASSCVIYVSSASILPTTRLSPSASADRDVGTGIFDLKFRQGVEKVYNKRQVILDTASATCDDSSHAHAALALSCNIPEEVSIFQPGWLRRLFRCPKYLSLSYFAVVGERKYCVRTRY